MRCTEDTDLLSVVDADHLVPSFINELILCRILMSIQIASVFLCTVMDSQWFVAYFTWLVKNDFLDFDPPCNHL